MALVAFLPALVTRARMAVNFSRLLACLECLVAASALCLDRSSQSEKRAKCGRGQYPLLSFQADLPGVFVGFAEARLAC